MKLALTAITLVALSLSCTTSAPCPASPAAPAATTPAQDPPAAVAEASTRCGGEIRRVDYWSGEYPNPILQIDTAFEVPGRLDPCEVAPTVTCRLEPGLYHPWTGSGRYATLRGSQMYRARVATELDITETESAVFAPGDLVEVVAYLSEGYCHMIVEGRLVEATCPYLLGVAGDAFELLGDERVPELQVFAAPCGAWVDVDDALMSHPSVREGVFISFGEVAPAD